MTSLIIKKKYIRKDRIRRPQVTQVTCPRCGEEIDHVLTVMGASRQHGHYPEHYSYKCHYCGYTANHVIYPEPVPPTHEEYFRSLKRKPAYPCSAYTRTPTGCCTNCGYDPGGDKKNL
jgi:predicted RNA-binding Zn-ribbon protein involved in translation (DUF1610 family)